MTIAAVVCRGYGPDPSIAFVVTRGYGAGAPIVVPPVVPDAYAYAYGGGGWTKRKKRKPILEDVEQVADAVVAEETVVAISVPELVRMVLATPAIESTFTYDLPEAQRLAYVREVADRIVLELRRVRDDEEFLMLH